MAEDSEKYSKLAVGEAEETLPNLTEYKPHGNPTIKPCYTLHCIISGTVTSFQYYHLESHSSFATEGNKDRIRIAFDGTPIVIHGRNLWKLYRYIMEHRMPWVWRADRDFAEDRKPILTGIEVGEKDQSEPTLRNAEPTESD